MIIEGPGNQKRSMSPPRVFVTTSWDDGDPLDLKLANLLTEYGVRGTFYVAPRNKERRSVMADNELRAINDMGFEIGAHSLTHPDLRYLDDQELDNEIGRSKSELEAIIGKPVTIFSYPWGKYNGRVVRAVAKAGFLGARTIKMFHVALGRDVLRMPTTVYCNPFPMWVWYRHCLKTANWRGLKELWHLGTQKSWDQVACGFFEVVLRQGGIWHLWGHSWEIEEHDLWDELRGVLETVSGRKSVKYVINSVLISRRELDEGAPGP